MFIPSINILKTCVSQLLPLCDPGSVHGNCIPTRQIEADVRAPKNKTERSEKTNLSGSFFKNLCLLNGS